MRNSALKVVRELHPDAYWSLDSDILVAPQALQLALESLSRFDAVGSRCYMTRTGTAFPSAASLTTRGRLRRVHSEDVCQVEVVMASVLDRKRTRLHSSN